MSQKRKWNGSLKHTGCHVVVVNHDSRIVTFFLKFWFIIRKSQVNMVGELRNQLVFYFV